VDLDGDGNLDIISGSWPGDIYLFRGTGKRKFAEPKTLIDAKQFGKGRYAGYTILQSSAVAAADWDGDGDTDLIVGGIFGEVFYFRNEGTPKAAGFAKPVKLKAGKDEKEIAVGGKAGPCVADWDRDGKLDLIVGSESQGVVWFRNVGTRSRPKLADPVTLVANDRGLGYRLKPHVTDWNNDGLPDLLVGSRESGDGPVQGGVWLFLHQRK
jgi:hypothetical protein